MTIVYLVLVFSIVFVFAIKTPILVQAMVGLVSIMYLKSDYVRRKEIGGIVDVLMVVGLWVVMLSADLYAFLFFTESPGRALSETFRWFITPNL